jgi:hypothetical protein
MEEGSLGMTVEGGLRLLADMGASDEVAPQAVIARDLDRDDITVA